MWHLLPHDPQRSDSLARALNISPVLGQLLLNRGIEKPDTARRFLGATLGALHPPALLPGINEAVDRILKAVRDGRRICIYGDYDVDGTTGIAILLLTLRSLGAANCDFYVPHRLTEGYGVNIEALRQLRESGTSLVITVDCGICSLEEAAEARQLGLELIVTDHHQCGDCLPQADSIVHPDVPGTSYPFRDLSGSGVALKLAWALCQRVAGGDRVSDQHRELLQDCVALAALGTVADVVPLHDENRILERFGLNRLI
jgi:single-stranded-DNA-specific exonuclease